MLSLTQAQDLTQRLVERARKAGADAADSLYSGSMANGVEVRLGELEGVDRSEGEEVGLRLFRGQRSASVASSDFSDAALDALVDRAMAMAAEAPDDPYAGLAPASMLMTGPLPDIAVADAAAPSAEDLRERAFAAEAAARAIPGIANSNGGSAGHSTGLVALATSHGFSGAYRSTAHSVSASVVAGEGGAMQRDSAWHSARHLEDLDQADMVGTLAGRRAAARLGAGKARAGRYPILFDPRVSASLLGHLSGAINGAAIARRSSFLLDRLGERLFAPGIEIVDDPLRARGLRSRPFDGEGLGVARTAIVADGRLTGWMADSAAARQLGIAPTGHAARGTGGPPGAGPSNLFLAAGKRSRDELLAAYPEAILVVELIGQGVNAVTGDYSRGAAGFWVRDGAIAEPVSEFTIASNLLDMFATLEPGSDLELRRGIDAPTVLVPEMTVASA